jgi:hypothetical protein
MSRLPHFLDNQLTDGGEFVSHSAAGRIRLIENPVISLGMEPTTFWLVA